MKGVLALMVLLLMSLLIAGCSSSSGNGSSSATTTSISGSGVKGPLAGAITRLYQVDLTKVDLKGSLLSEGSTNNNAAITDLSIADGLSGLLLLEFIVDGDTVEINTGNAPVFNRLVTVIDVQRIYDGDSIYASPLTTIAVSLAQSKADSSSPYIGNGDFIISEAEFVAALGFAQNQVKSTVGFGLDSSVDIFVVPPMITAETNTTAEQTAVVKYRQAIEALAAVSVKTAADSTVSDTAQEIFDALTEDLTDGDIDGQSSTGAVGTLIALDVPIATSMAAVNLSSLLIPGTTTPVTDIETELVAETSTTGETTDTTELGDGTIAVDLAMPELIADSDGDGVDDASDAFPADPTESADTDGDTVGDNADAFPNDATETVDTDSDGVGDNADVFPNDATETADTDSDGVGDNGDAFPNDATETVDTDGDFVGNNADTDDDGDSVADTSDAFPLDATESADTDSDGVGDNSDAFPNDATETVDTDSDGVGDNSDVFPNDATETVDTDGDGVGDNADAFPNDPTRTVALWAGTVQLGAAVVQTNLEDIAIDSAGSVYAVGFTNGDLDGQTRTGLIDMYITKYDSLGAKQFTRMLGAMWGADRRTAHAHAVATDSNNNVYVVGYTGGSFDGNNWLGIWNMFLVKFDSDGNKIFSATFGASAYTYPTDITIDASDNIYVTGYETGSFGGAPIGSKDLFLAKFDTNGNQAFVKKLGVSSKVVMPQSIVSDTSGNVYVAGYTSGNLNGETLNGSADIFVVKFDAAGNVLLTRLFGVSGAVFTNSDMAVDTSGNFYVTGYTSKTFDGVTPTGLLDTFLVMYDSAGTKVSTKMYGVAGAYVQGMAIKADSIGNVYITGSTSTGLDGNSLAGNSDAFLLKYDSSGVAEFASQLGASGGSPSGRAIAIDSSDNIFISGNTDRGLDGNSMTGTQDFFISKYDSSGNLK
jgi:Beta-propeller repeat